MADENSRSLLVVIFDANPVAWGGIAVEGNETQISLTRCLESLMVLCNSYLLLKHNNLLAFVAASTNGSKFLYPKASCEGIQSLPSQDSKYEKFAEFNDTVLREIKELVGTAQSTGKRHTSKMPHTTVFYNSRGELVSDLPGALCKALCYIHRMEKEYSVGAKLQPRILIIKASPDDASHYMPVMNSIFAAQKSNTCIDACVLYEHSGYLQQATDITGGVYLKIPETQALLQYLMWLYLPDFSTRAMMVLPSSTQIDYRAACFCHKKLVDVGFVCSVCLSIYCNPIPICRTCQTRFKLPTRPKKKKK
ncbi:general transcription factor IIH subunit 3 [Nematostella vectensis]|uniref:general transcription factor IIH subunit 3 n=1 Tax=Nematostella vectensis TaxID=45351 RepID=UPI0020776AD0|nr:general transcription factor IIH subunit 3 [Nematostella vectensis]